MMFRYTGNIFKRLIPAFLMFPCVVFANTAELDEATKIYYAGSPDRAISLIRPLADSGDAEAQYFLGNIIYSLSKTEKYSNTDDPVKWYKMAAVQNFPAANYALGVIFHNKWSHSRQKDNLAIAISYYEKAQNLGYEKARAPLSQLKSQDKGSNKGNSLSYSYSPSEGLKLFPQRSLVNNVNKLDTENSKEVASRISDEDSSRKSVVDKLLEVATKIPDIDRGEDTNTERLASIAKDIPEEGSNIGLNVVNLTDVAGQCGNYTQTGFKFYAESIKGALLVGEAKIDAIKSDQSKSASRTIKLSDKQFGVTINFILKEVPKNITLGLKKEENFGITGIIENSQLNSSNCNIVLTYKAI